MKETRFSGILQEIQPFKSLNSFEFRIIFALRSLRVLRDTAFQVLAHARSLCSLENAERTEPIAKVVILVKTGIHCFGISRQLLDSRLRWNDSNSILWRFARGSSLTTKRKTARGVYGCTPPSFVFR